jgi:pimeloyl-ACP methyl ester carboxylesterase
MSEDAFSTTPRLHHVQCLDARGLHRMAYTEWGEAANPKVLICVHGLTRQGRDFDVLARSLSKEYRVVCPDVVGRGQSDWLADPVGYAIPTYVADMVTLLARLNAQVVHWLGTSMGGLIGMAVASLPGSPLSKLVLNDVGPKLEFTSLKRIGQYLGQQGHWESEQAAAAYLWEISKTFGPHTDEEWLALSRPQLKPDGHGFKLHYDMTIAQGFASLTPELTQAGEVALWMAYDQIRCPTLLLRGAESDLLSPETAGEMSRRGPRASLREFAGVGHAPSLVHSEQIEVVREFLLAS